MVEYHLKIPDLQNKENLSICLIELYSKKRILYFSSLKEKLLNDADQKAITLLAKIQKKKVGFQSKIDTLSLNEIKISLKQLREVLCFLQPTGKLFWNKKPLKVEINKPVIIQFNAEEGQDALKLHPKIIWNKDSFDFSQCDVLFNEWAIISGSLFFFEEAIENRWLNLFENSPFVLRDKQKKRFLEDFEHISFTKAKKQVFATPILVLKDVYGMFADLWMDYKDYQLSFHDLQTPQLRNRKLEEEWEKDLVEVGYKPSIDSTSSHYFISSDKVYKALVFLIELGWELRDQQNKKVVLSDHLFLKIGMEDQSLQVNGSLKFENHLVDLDQITKALEKNRRFIELGDQSGLIDIDHLKKEYPFLLQRNKKYKKAELSQFLSVGNVAWDERLSSLAETLKNPSLFDENPSEEFCGRLHSYQKQGLAWLHCLYQSNLGAFLADEMGLGKTVQVLAFFSHLRNFFPVLVVAPASVLMNWKSEFKRFLPQAKVFVYYGKDRTLETGKNTFVLTTYGLLREDKEIFSQAFFECVVLDESTMIKNPKSKAARAAFSLQTNFKIALSGTPIENSLQEIISQFAFVLPDLFAEKQDLYLQEVKKKIAPFILRRSKSQVEDFLPEKIEQEIWIEMSEKQKLTYDKLMLGIRQEFSTLEEVKKNRMKAFEKLLRLRQVCCHPLLIQEDLESPKLEQLMLDLASLGPSNKAIIFSQFTQMLKIIEQRLIKEDCSYLYLDGSVPIKERKKRYEAFQEEQDKRFFLVSLKTASYGINLTAADYVFLFDPWWNVSVEDQAIARAHRLGRTKSVIARRYLIKDSIEEKMQELKAFKSSQSHDLLDQELSNLDDLSLLHLLS